MANIQNRSVLTAERLAQQLKQLADQHNIKTWCLAYSGGVDSQVLLHLLHLTKLQVTAVYIDHGLQAVSTEWAKHCAHQCQQFDVPFQIISVDALPKKGEGPEAAARMARYAAFKTLIKDDMCLLTAQHQDDQSETVLLQLLRGAGAAGLSAMPELSEFSAGWHFRPLIGDTQESILQYAEQHNLSWVDDPTNQQQDYYRNYLRHTVIPEIKQRWPSLDKTLSVFAQQQAENAELLTVLGDMDLQTVLIEEDCLEIALLKKFDDARLRNLLRCWVKRLEYNMPSRAVLLQIVQQLQGESHDTHSLVSWAGVEVRRFRDRLFLLKTLQHDPGQMFELIPNQPLLISSIEKTLAIKESVVNENTYQLSKEILSLPLSIKFRQGGELLKPAGRSGSHTLKSLFQEAAIPSWQRDRIPLLYAGDELVAIVGYWIADKFAVKGEGVLPVIL